MLNIIITNKRINKNITSQIFTNFRIVPMFCRLLVISTGIIGSFLETIFWTLAKVNATKNAKVIMLVNKTLLKIAKIIMINAKNNKTFSNISWEDLIAEKASCKINKLLEFTRAKFATRAKPRAFSRAVAFLGEANDNCFMEYFLSNSSAMSINEVIIVEVNKDTKSLGEV